MMAAIVASTLADISDRDAGHAAAPLVNDRILIIDCGRGPGNAGTAIFNTSVDNQPIY
jgi:hypothetical protein